MSALQKGDYKLLLHLIEICQHRGAFKVKEMMTVAKLYNRLQKCVEEQEKKTKQICGECKNKITSACTTTIVKEDVKNETQEEDVFRDYFYEEDQNQESASSIDMLPKLSLSLPTILEEEEPADSPPLSTPRTLKQPKLFSHTLE
jgi:hypothetical protein